MARRDTLADTVIVRIVSGSVWTHPVGLREDLRIGSVDGDGPEAFGSIFAVGVQPDGTMVVFDTQVPALRRFSASGKYLGTIGREGKGPGEYSAHPNGMMIDAEGRVILSDPPDARISAYSPEGGFLGVVGRPTGLHSIGGWEVAGDDAGHIYVRILMVPGPPIPNPWPIGAEVRDANGSIVDTIPPPLLEGKHADFFAISPDGSLLVGSRSRFTFEVHHKDGSVLRVEAPFKRAAYSETERAKLRVALAPAATADGEREAAVPEKKAAYVEVFFDPSGRIWLRRPVTPTSGKGEVALPRFQPSALDAFAKDGAYLGTVDLPPRSAPIAVTATQLYAIEMGKYDEQYVVRYDLRLP